MATSLPGIRHSIAEQLLAEKRRSEAERQDLVERLRRVSHHLAEVEALCQVAGIGDAPSQPVSWDAMSIPEFSRNGDGATP